MKLRKVKTRGNLFSQIKNHTSNSRSICLKKINRNTQNSPPKKLEKAKALFSSKSKKIT